jgi:nucleotide-binding universal stress UspA family protein
MEKLKILIPTDFSVQAEYAYLMVKKLEEKMPLDVHFLHVMAMPDTVTLDKNGNVQTCGDIDDKYVTQQKDIADRKLENLKTLYGQDINTKLVFGKLTDNIKNIAEAENFDLIVMGTKGAWGLKDKLSGTETQMVARKTQVPLLSLMCDRSDLVIQNVLLVHNFNQPHNENLQLLKKLISAFNVKVHLLQIISAHEEQTEYKIQSNMEEFVKLNELSNCEYHIVSDKSVENGVIHFNQMNNMDIICIGTHGRGGIFHHSATEALINHMYKPIISFHLKP